jgi:DNA-binding NarL/FixJ family response regulator
MNAKVMAVLALHRAERAALRVAIVAPPARVPLLTEVVTRMAHVIVDLNAADVVLSEEIAVVTDKPLLVLGGRSEDGDGVLPPDASDEQIDAALRAIAAGLRVAAKPNARAFGEEFGEHRDRATILLTPRELQVLAAIGDGLSNKAIARRLAISQHTVKFHIESLFRKLGVRTRAEAVARGNERRDLLHI